MQIPDPHYMELKDWADATMFAANGSHIIFESLTDPKDWQRWGCCFLNEPSLGAANPPNPYAFDDWREWGKRLCDALSTVR